MNTAASATLLAQATNTFDPNKVTPGLLGFVVVVSIGLATWFLLRSMTRHLRNVDPRFADRDERDENAQHDAEDPAGRTADARDRTPDERTRP